MLLFPLPVTIKLDTYLVIILFLQFGFGKEKLLLILFDLITFKGTSLVILPQNFALAL